MSEMTYDRIVEVNKTMKLTPIKGKDYATVNQRVKAFRMLYPEGKIDTDITYLDDGMVVVKATIYDDKGNMLAAGHSYEREGSSMINKTSFVENCETSAVGRALGFVGLGIDTAICSADELENALEVQAVPECQKCHKKVYDAKQVGESKAYTLEKFKKAYVLCPACLEKAKAAEVPVDG